MNVLVICFSGISNVASIVPVLDGAVRNNPNCRFWILSRTFLAPLFSKIENTTFYGADIRGVDKGAKGAWELYKKLSNIKFDVVIDLQNNYYSKIISLAFKMSGVKRLVINESNADCKRLINLGANKYKPLKTIFNRYNELFEKAGIKSDDKFISLPMSDCNVSEKLMALYGEKQGKWIGIAPISLAKGKTLPFNKTKDIIAHFDKIEGCKIFLFGAGELENELLSDWSELYKNVYAVHSALRLEEELDLMGLLDVMVSMDSGNMHLAALKSTPVISIWGETHYYAGFLGWGQTPSDCIGVNLDCRPCTIHKNKTCKFGTYQCLKEIQSDDIIKAIEKKLELK